MSRDAGSIPAASISKRKDLQRSIDEKAPNSSDSDADSASGTPPNALKNIPDLQVVMDWWPHLPEPVKAGIVAMVKAHQKAESPLRPWTNGRKE